MPGTLDDNKRDGELLELLKANPRAGFTLMFDEYFEEVCRHIFRYVPDIRIAQDIAQDLFVELWTKRDKLNITSSPGAYLYRMAVSRALNHIRDNRRHVHSDVTVLRTVSVNAPEPGQVMDADSLNSIVTVAIDNLPERCRQVFMLSRFEDMSNAQIADALDISVKTVENQMTKALRAIKEAIEKYKGSA